MPYPESEWYRQFKAKAQAYHNKSNSWQPALNVFEGAMKGYHEKMSELHKPENGLLPPVTEWDRERLIASHNTVAMYAAKLCDDVRQRLCDELATVFNDLKRQPQNNDVIKQQDLKKELLQLIQYAKYAKLDDLIKYIQKFRQKRPGAAKLAKLAELAELAELARLAEKLSMETAETARLLLRYHPQPGQEKSFATLQEENRPLRLEVTRKKEGGEVGHYLSKRCMIRYPDDKGKWVLGFFTPVHYSQPVRAIESGLQEIASKIADQDARAYVKGLLSSIMSRRRCDTSDAVMYLLMKCKAYKSNDNKYNKDSVANGLYYNCPNCPEFRRKYHNLESFKNAVGTEALNNIAELLKSQYYDYAINHVCAGIPDGSRIDNRSAAMSDVADLLGVSDVLARAVPMTVVENGKEIHGTFMWLADGIDPAHPTREDVNMLTKSQVEVHSDFIKDLAIIGILDILCGNPDRHEQNMFYKLEPNGEGDLPRALHTQGIDHDTSGGTEVPDLAWFAKLCVIPESMAQKIMNLQPSVLVSYQRKYGFSDKELDARKRTLLALQHCIKQSQDTDKRLDLRYKSEENPYPLYTYAYGDMSRYRELKIPTNGEKYPPYIRVVPDDDFGRLDFMQLAYLDNESQQNGKAKDEKYSNIFQQAWMGLNEVPGCYWYNISKKIQPPQVGKVLDGDNRAKIEGLKAWKDRFKFVAHWLMEDEDVDMVNVVMEYKGIVMEDAERKKTEERKKLKNAKTPGLHETEYQDMKKAFQEVRDFHEQVILRLLHAENEEEKVLTVADWQKIEELNKALEGKAKQYLDSMLSGGKRAWNYGEADKKRILAAEEVLRLAREGKKLRESEAQLIIINNAQVKERQLRKERKEGGPQDSKQPFSWTRLAEETKRRKNQSSGPRDRLVNRKEPQDNYAKKEIPVQKALIPLDQGASRGVFANSKVVFKSHPV